MRTSHQGTHMLKHSASVNAATVGSFGQTLVATVLFVAGLMGVAQLWATWPRTSGTSPLAALFALAWSCAYLAAALLTWRGSRFAASAFVAAVALLLPVFSFIFPGNWMLAAPPFALTLVLAVVGYRYLHRRVSPARQGAL